MSRDCKAIASVAFAAGQFVISARMAFRRASLRRSWSYPNGLLAAVATATAAAIVATLVRIAMISIANYDVEEPDRMPTAGSTQDEAVTPA